MQGGFLLERGSCPCEAAVVHAAAVGSRRAGPRASARPLLEQERADAAVMAGSAARLGSTSRERACAVRGGSGPGRALKGLDSLTAQERARLRSRAKQVEQSSTCSSPADHGGRSDARRRFVATAGELCLPAAEGSGDRGAGFRAPRLLPALPDPGRQGPASSICLSSARSPRASARRWRKARTGSLRACASRTPCSSESETCPRSKRESFDTPMRRPSSSCVSSCLIRAARRSLPRSHSAKALYPPTKLRSHRR